MMSICICASKHKNSVCGIDVTYQLRYAMEAGISELPVAIAKESNN
jgi:hypothetical protein